jgi:serine/threonine protein kinase
VSDQPAGKPFGKFLLLERVGHGAVGIVYKAQQTELGRTVALKAMQTEDEANPEAVSRFLHEARAAARLKHPNVVPIHEVGEHEGSHYFTMDYMDGPSLRALADEKKLPVARALEVVRDVARAIHFAHVQGIIHRDLKPSNILLDAGGRVYVSDFGLAKDVGREGMTESGDVLGTPAYMSPEQARGHAKFVDARSDVYSIGAVLYHLLTGRPPFTGESTIQVILAVMGTDPLPPRRLVPAIPVDAETICLTAMEKAPVRRYSTAAAMADDIDRFLTREPIAARPTPVTHRTWRKVKRRWMPLSLGACGLLLAAGSSIWLAHSLSVRGEIRDLRAKAEEAYRADRWAEALKLYSRLSALDAADAQARERADDCERRLKERK